ncbi:hypothetical protein POTOM_028626 [Populus tomentosa]|uniref:Sugar phosphate transporter domain-containing protein n=2 Tax=Populus TaxID=3689 RepID=A0A8X8CLJ3_POPTO|nr:hypothetical protein POTOM_028626 [Populus tomentosa]
MILLLPYYSVDYMVIIGNNEEATKDLKRFLSTCFKIKDLGPMKCFLGVEVARSKAGIAINQQKYASDMLEETGLLGAKPVKFPMEQNVKPTPSDDELCKDPGIILVVESVKNSLNASEETHRLEELEFADGALCTEHVILFMISNPTHLDYSNFPSSLIPFLMKHQAWLISLDSPDSLYERSLIDDTDKANQSEERVLKLHELNGVVDQSSSPLKREVVNRLSYSFSMKSHENDEIDLEDGKLEKDKDRPIRSKGVVRIQNEAFLSGLAYCISSCSMILVNKYVLSSYDFNAGISLMLYQNFISVIIVSTLSFLGVISTEPLTWRLIKVWLPVNFIFVGMLVTSMFSHIGEVGQVLACHACEVSKGRIEVKLKEGLGDRPPIEVSLESLIEVYLSSAIVSFIGNNKKQSESLKYINVAMVTILKNVTNVITAVGEMYLFQKDHDSRVWAALFLMIISAISGGITDLSFHAVGYAWQIINCFLTASYSLTLRRVMDTAKHVTKSGNLNEFSMVMLNNTLSLPLGLILIFVFNEVDYLSRTPLLRLPTFWFVVTLSGFLGLAISFTSMWFLHQTGATTYSLVGSLNKIPLSVAGILLFHVPTSLQNSASILFGLLAGVFFARAKMRERSQS